MRNVIELTRRLVSFNTISQNSNLGMVSFLQALFEKMGFAVTLQKKTINDVEKANLVARIGPRGVNPLMLSAHMDTVPFGQMRRWKTEPLVLTESGVKLFGRGSVDMKGPLAALICAVEPLLTQHSSFKRELIFGLTFDEEVGLVGAKHLVLSNEVCPQFILVAEPTKLVPMRMHKGHISLRVVCRGESAHGSNPKIGKNAILMATDAIRILQEFGEELESAQEPILSPPYATLNIGKIKGGTKTNIVPARCEVEFEIRPIPGQSATAIRDSVASRMENLGFDAKGDSQVIIELLDRTKQPTDPISTPADSLLIKIAEHVTGQEARGVSYSTDASMFQPWGSHCLILGPGDIANAHIENEFVEINQLTLAVDYFRNIIDTILHEGG